jgi:DNA-binding HxlR family transcriptional regulator
MEAILRQLTGPWTGYILWLLRSHGALRFGALKAKMPAISSKMLTERLRQLETARLVHRDYRATIPPAVTYSLTERALALNGVLDSLNDIALRWQTEDAAPATALTGVAQAARGRLDNRTAVNLD